MNWDDRSDLSFRFGKLKLERGLHFIKGSSCSCGGIITW